MTLEVIRSSDGPLLRTIHLRMYADAPDAFRETLAQAQARSDQEWQALAEQLADEPNAVGFVYYEDAEAGGFVYANRADTRIPPNSALVSHFWVDPRLRRNGIGSTLMKAVEDWSQAHGISQMFLGVTEGNQSAISFYKKFGYVDTGDRLPWPPDPSKQIYVLARKLS